jgi:hypothetical protein
MQIALRPARADDFDFCAGLYFAEMKTIIQELNLDLDRHAAGFRQQWELTQVRDSDSESPTRMSGSST